jgi:hypothetical protein
MRRTYIDRLSGRHRCKICGTSFAPDENQGRGPCKSLAEAKSFPGGQVCLELAASNAVKGLEGLDDDDVSAKNDFPEADL